MTNAMIVIWILGANFVGVLVLAFIGNQSATTARRGITAREALERNDPA